MPSRRTPARAERARARAPRAPRRQIGIAPNTKLVNTFTNEEFLEEFMKSHQIVIDDEFGPLGAGGMRALCTASPRDPRQ